jgi:hypothetical protein
MRQSLLPRNVGIRFYMPSYLNQLGVDLRGLSKTQVVINSYNFIFMNFQIPTLKKKSCPHSRITSSKIFHAVRAGFSCSESKKTGNLVRNLK